MFGFPLWNSWIYRSVVTLIFIILILKLYWSILQKFRILWLSWQEVGRRLLSYLNHAWLLNMGSWFSLVHSSFLLELQTSICQDLVSCLMCKTVILRSSDVVFVCNTRKCAQFHNFDLSGWPLLWYSPLGPPLPSGISQYGRTQQVTVGAGGDK
jgi:hypothetical protein